MEKIRAGAEIDQHGIGESGTDRMAVVSVYSFWETGLRHLYNHLRKSKTSNRLYLSMI